MKKVIITLILVTGLICFVAFRYGHWHKRRRLVDSSSSIATTTTTTTSAAAATATASKILYTTTATTSAAASSHDHGGGGGVWYVPMEVKDQLLRIYATHGVGAMLKASEVIETTNASIEANCHPLRHELGRVVFTRLLAATAPRNDATQALAAATAANTSALVGCNGGYLHGVLELFISARGKQTEQVAEQVTAVGAVVSQKNLHDFYYQFEVWHGVGHGVMKAVDQSIDHAIAACSSTIKATRKGGGGGGGGGAHLLANPFTQSSRQRIDCINGALMELMVAIDTQKVAESVLVDRCARVGGGLSSICSMYAAIAYLKFHPRRYNEAAEWCVDAMNSKLSSSVQHQCAYGVGMQAVKENPQQPSLAEEACYAYSADRQPEFRRSCIAGLFGYVAFGFRWRLPSVDEFCHSFHYEENRKFCEQHHS